MAPDSSPGQSRTGSSAQPPDGLVLLVGLSGTGKTTVGRLLAQRLGVPFVDTDAEIERRSGCAIQEIFTESGESAFRALEREAVADCCKLASGIVATGGGAPLDPSSRARMQEAGRIIWLDAPTTELVERLTCDGPHRPLLADDPVTALNRLRFDREPVYSSLGPRVDASGLPEQVAERILHLILPAGSEPAAARWAEPIPVRTASHAYSVYVGPGMLGAADRLLAAAGLRGTLRVVVDDRVDALHGDRLRQALGDRRFTWHPVPSGEEHKTLAQADRTFDALLAAAPERSDIVVAFGGGVVGDLAGFVAATLLRGVRFVQIPTTVLAQVDSSVGGKVAVDHPRGKNLIGAFHQPSLVIADVDLLRSLPAREIAAGWAEVVKIAVVQDAAFFDQLERDVEALLALEPVSTTQAIRRAVALKARLVEADERDVTGDRAILNYGHTVGHALEAATEFSGLLHGEAVAVGMRAAAHIAVRMGLHPADAQIRQEALLRRLGLPDRCAGVSIAVRTAMGFDKKRFEGKMTWILPAGLGQVRLIQDVPATLVDEAVELVTGDVEPVSHE